MFYLKNDDMEELFRKAAENYELDASKASDWDSIHKKLHETSEGNNESDGGKKKKRRFIFWWFLLFPAGWMAHNTWDKIGKNNVAEKQVVLQNQVVKKDPSAGNTTSQPQQKETQPGEKATNKVHTVAPGSTPSTKNELELKQDEEVADNKNTEPATGNSQTLKKRDNNTGTGETNGKDIEGNKKTAYTVSKQQQNVSGQRNAKNQAFRKKTSNDITQQVTASQQNETDIVRAGTDKSTYLVASLQKVDEKTFALPQLFETIQIPAGITGNNGIDKPADSVSKEKDRDIAKSKDNYFYVQAMFGPDLTNIKFQRISGVGTSVGLLVGYRFNKRFHVEAGGYWEKKVYYTDGKYFDKSKLPYLRDHEIYNVNGKCSMITIPVSLRYNFISKKNSDWFVTTGAAAYLMQKEDYDITYEYYGDARTRAWAYKDPPKSWLATVNIGVGYQTTVLRSFNFRVEPYYRIPVSGAGTGNLSLTSAGIYIGIGRKF